MSKDALQSSEPEGESGSHSVGKDIAETFALLQDIRIATLYPLILASAINLAILSSVFIVMMQDTMTKWGDQT